MTALSGREDYAAVADDLLAEIDGSRNSSATSVCWPWRTAGGRDRGRPVDLMTVISECAEIARAMGEEKAIRVDPRIGQRPVVFGSALHLRRVILNLTDNAIRYSPAGATVEVLVTGDHGQASVRVSDHGCGIAPEDLPHIFEPFYRADPARARETGGTGLGLAIADQIVRAHGGAICRRLGGDHRLDLPLTLPLAPCDKTVACSMNVLSPEFHFRVLYSRCTLNA